MGGATAASWWTAWAFGGYNRSFRPARTSKDWLNRDEKEVDRYLSEERCSFRFTLNGYDSLFTALERLCDKELLARAPKDLPVLFLSGDDDPVGDRGPRRAEGGPEPAGRRDAPGGSQALPGGPA